ncbi:hypothetical protein [Trichlorobacter lovleyi]|jgi:hypothetical protein|uniref:Uncharacterized protein n=1 Tax=Trichlorobacter lovleyi (strain ATCC BAA-1151 / DSM 17278 / SZ) TaxID=398767 RepID=B3EA49_TRIL1|nr:hypothetical protein [Trichlorobacter lovleyi]ACD93877.1 conserved hypothetical protein [Trichlorobacter lovleyi SZ]
MRLKILLFLMLISMAATAWAGPFTDEMSKCLVRSTSEADKTLLIKWIFAAMATHPDVRSLSAVTPEKGEQLNKETAKLVMRLLTVSCKTETRQAVEFEGEDTFKASFGVLGQVAMQGLMANAEVSNYFSGFEKHLDAKELQRALGKEQTKPATPTK